METARWSDSRRVRERLADHGFPGFLSVDLEGRGSTNGIGAIRPDDATRFTRRRERHGLRLALTALVEFADGATCLVGHNIIEHDLALLGRHAPELSLLDSPAIDTLYLSPPAYPENP